MIPSRWRILERPQAARLHSFLRQKIRHMYMVLQTFASATDVAETGQGLWAGGRATCDIICEESVTAQPSPHVVFIGTEAAAWSRVYARHASALQRSWWLSSCQCRHRHLSSNVEFDATPRTRQWAVDDPVRSVQGGHWHLQALLLHASLAAH